MKAGFRGWLFRVVAAFTGLFGLFVFLTFVEMSRFYGVSSLMKSGVIGLVVSFLLFTSALVGQWAWKRYAIVSMSLGLAFALAYFAFRPEMIRDDVLSQLRTPALTVDLVFYRGIALRGDSAREAKIDRLNYAYGFFKTLVSPEAILPEASGESLSEDPR